MTDQAIQRVATSYYQSLPNKDVRHPKVAILFSGVVCSGKSTVARAVEKELLGIRICNDDIRGELTVADPAIELKAREAAKLKVVSGLLERVTKERNGLLIMDASCDRGYDFYWDWSQKFGYDIILLRFDIPRQIIEQRVYARGDQKPENVGDFLNSLDVWWQQWQSFGEAHTADMTITVDMPVEVILGMIRQKIESL